MKIAFNVTDADLEALRQHTRQRSPRDKRKVQGRFAAAVVVVAALAFVLGFQHGIGAAFIAALIAVHLGAVWLPFLLVLVRRSKARQLYQNQQGAMELEVLPDGLRVCYQQDETRYAWENIGAVTTNPTYTFIAVSKARVLVVPHQRISAGSYSTFLKAFADTYASRSESAAAMIQGNIGSR